MSLGASVRRCVGASALLLAACTDPRARPVPPFLQLQFSPTFVLHSPGRILGSIYMQDADGVSSLRLQVLSDDSTFAGDSLLGFLGEPEITKLVDWMVPAGLPAGMGVSVIAEVEDFAGFVTRDSLRILVQ